ETRIEAVFLIERDVLGALSEGEKPDMTQVPAVELRHGAIEQFSGNAAFLQLGANRQRAEKADAAPAGRKVRTDQLAVEARAETRDMRRAVAAADIIAVVPERRQVGDAEISGERLAQDQRGVIQIVLIKSADNGAARD